MRRAIPIEDGYGYKEYSNDDYPAYKCKNVKPEMHVFIKMSLYKADEALPGYHDNDGY